MTLSEEDRARGTLIEKKQSNNRDNEKSKMAQNMAPGGIMSRGLQLARMAVPQQYTVRITMKKGVDTFMHPVAGGEWAEPYVHTPHTLLYGLSNGIGLKHVKASQTTELMSIEPVSRQLN